MNQYVKSLGQRSFSSKVIVRAYRQTDTYTHRTDCSTWTTKVVDNDRTCCSWFVYQIGGAKAIDARSENAETVSISPRNQGSTKHPAIKLEWRPERLWQNQTTNRCGDTIAIHCRPIGTAPEAWWNSVDPNCPKCGQAPHTLEHWLHCPGTLQ